MGEILEVFQNSPVYNLFEWDSERLNTGNSSKLIFTIFCSTDYRAGIRWSVSDLAGDIVEEEFVDILGGFAHTFVVDIKTKYVQFFVLDMNVLPCDLKTQAYFILDNKV